MEVEECEAEIMMEIGDIQNRIESLKARMEERLESRSELHAAGKDAFLACVPDMQVEQLRALFAKDRTQIKQRQQDCQKSLYALQEQLKNFVQL